MKTWLTGGLLAASFGVPAQAAPTPVAPVSPIATSPRLVWTGVAESPDGRVFVNFPRLDASRNPAVAVLGKDGSLTPYPGGGWNQWKAGSDPSDGFVSAAALRVGPDGRLWVVDSGVPGPGKAPLTNAAKIVVIDLKANKVARVYRLPPPALKPHSQIAGLALTGSHAYLADAGAAGLIVVDLKTGDARRVLDRDPSTTARRPALVDGVILRGADGKPAVLDADIVAVTPDGRFLFYQPLPGPLYRIATTLVDDPKQTQAALSRAVDFWYNTPSLGGMVIDAGGNCFLADLGSNAILRMSPDRHVSLVVRDDRLHWPAQPALDGHGGLLVPVAQLDRAAPFNHGHNAIAWPLPLFRLPIGTNTSR